METTSQELEKDIGEQNGACSSGINVCGYLRTESGVGVAIRRYLRALRALDVPIALKDLSTLNVNRAQDETLECFDADRCHDINLVCADVELHYAILSYLGEKFFNDRYNIGVWWWELPRFPKNWHDRFAYYDEIWVGTSFVANSLALSSPIPIVRIPPVLTVGKPGSREAGRGRLSVSAEQFVYLFIFDFHSHFQRKNPLAAVEAFRAAFAPSDPVRLVIKCVNERSNPAAFAALSEQSAGYPIAIHAGYWTADEMRDLMAACDAYVSLHRSEGAGLTITDAMALGKPVIATGWSGNMDFMNVANSFPVRYQLVKLEENIGPYRAGEMWAEPSIEHAAETMRYVFQEREQAQARGQAARRDIETYYSEAKVANLIRERLEAIALRRRLPEFQQETRARFRSYQQLPDRIRAVVRAFLPPAATVAVVNKGDSELLELDGRRAWHFPQRQDGKYAGYYPADSAAAIDHLEMLRSKGANFLLLPCTAFWWLEHYGEFREHLHNHYQIVVRQEDSCLIFAL